MTRVQLIHWDKEQAEARAKQLIEAGYEVNSKPPTADSLRKLKSNPPEAIIIDLSRIPSQGGDLAITFRKQKSTRGVPLVFVDGELEKVARIKELLPDAVYTTWSKIDGTLKKSIADPPTDPIVPDSVFEAYKKTPLYKKLGIVEDAVVALVGSPVDFEKILGKLPAGAAVKRRARGDRQLTLWFPKDRNDLENRIDQMGAFADHGGLWIVWPKKASGIKSDLSQVVVRKTGLAAGLVDYKVCSIDATWTGLRFTIRKRDNS
jgi:CheY-like chemotaxis protein